MRNRTLLKKIFLPVFPLLLLALILWYYLRPPSQTQEDRTSIVKELKAPDLTQLPNDAVGQSVLRGKQILENTHFALPQYVGARMTCTNCHLNSGTTANAGPWVGITVRFPQYRSRSGKMDTLADRVNDCFERSLNGKR